MAYLFIYLETCAQTNIKNLWNKFEHWLQVDQAMILHTQEMLYMSKEFYFVLFLIILKIFDVKLAFFLNVNVTPHNSCNHGSQHSWLQSLELGTDCSCRQTALQHAFSKT